MPAEVVTPKELDDVARRALGYADLAAAAAAASLWWTRWKQEGNEWLKEPTRVVAELAALSDISGALQFSEGTYETSIYDAAGALMQLDNYSGVEALRDQAKAFVELLKGPQKLLETAQTLVEDKGP